jgi:type IV pilus assembly protein PilN
MSKLNLNLASDPFRRDRAMMISTSALSVVLFGLLVTLVSLAYIERGRADQARARLADLEKQQATQSAELARLQAVMRQTENAEVLDRSIFLNTLIRRKGVSWTRIFSDIASVLPPDVRLVSLRPQLAGENELVLTMTVASASSSPVVNFLMKLEQSPVFVSPAVANWRPPGQTETNYTYVITASYSQKL